MCSSLTGRTHTVYYGRETLSYAEVLIRQSKPNIATIHTTRLQHWARICSKQDQIKCVTTVGTRAPRHAPQSWAKPPGATFGIPRMAVRWGWRVTEKAWAGLRHVWAQRHRGSCLSLLVHGDVCTHKHACTRSWASSRHTHTRSDFISLRHKQRRHSFTGVKWLDYCNFKLPRIVSVYQWGKHKMNERTLNTLN